MDNDTNNALRDIPGYFTETLRKHGATARGVDWNGEDSQRLRFDQLSRIITGENAFSISDLGCGYGAYYDFLAGRYADFSYAGFDITPEMFQVLSLSRLQVVKHCDFPSVRDQFVSHVGADKSRSARYQSRSRRFHVIAPSEKILILERNNYNSASPVIDTDGAR